MKKIFVIIFCLISIVSYCQDTIYISNIPKVVKIVDIDNDFIYYNIPGDFKTFKAHKSVATYILYDPNEFLKKNKEYDYFVLNKEEDSINYKIGYLRYNLSKHQKGMCAGLSIATIGLLTSITSPYLIKVPEDYEDYPEYSNKVKTVVFTGAGLTLIGAIISLNSYKWIKRASIEPTLYGAKFKYNF